MTTQRATRYLGAYVYAAGIAALAVVCLAWGDFDPGQPVPRGFPDRAVLAYAAAVFMLASGAGVAWRPTRVFAAASLCVYYAFVVVVLNGRVVLAHHTVFGSYSSAAEQLAIAAGALIIFAGRARIDATLAARLTRLGQVTFGVCAILFGAAHFVYLDLTAPLVPRWLPPTQDFWAYATGLGHIAAGIAIATGVQSRLAAILLTAMYASFTPLVHIPLLLADPASHTNWAENAENLALVGVAWVVADSLTRLLGPERREYLPG